MQGTPKQYKTTADSGKEIVTYFCGDCGTNFYRESATFGTNKVLKVYLARNPLFVGNFGTCLKLTMGTGWRYGRGGLAEGR